MLTELRLTNFRIFDDEVRVRFRPITILIGRNNAGKSSIVKFLLMLQQSLSLGNPQFLAPEGNRVNLGLFSELKNSLTKKQALQFTLTAEQFTTPSYMLSNYMNTRGLKIGTPNMNLLTRVSAKVSYRSESQSGSTEYSLTDAASDTEIIKGDNKVADDSIFLDLSAKLRRELSVNPAEIKFKDIKKDKEILGEMKKRISRLAAETEFLDTLRNEINSIRHLSPIREEYQRVILVSPPPATEVGQKGQYAIPHLQRMIASNKENYEFIRPHLENIAGISNIRFKGPKYATQCLAKNKITGAEVHIKNYGFGVSQCLPIFIQGAIMPRFTSLIVEQPEAHLHPTAQLDMGGFFYDLWKKRKVRSIIETHSDNILLRLRRLIAAGKLDAKDVSVAYFPYDKDSGNMPTIKNLDIQKNGSMGSGLPMEFFGENLREVLKMGAKK